MEELEKPRDDEGTQGHAGYRFAGFILDLDRGTLSRDGRELPIRPKSFDVLAFLAGRACTVVAREEIMAEVWPGLVVTEDSVTQCLTDIRRVLDDPERVLVRTIPRRGYMLDTATTPLTENSIPGGVNGERPARPAARRGRPSRWTLLGFVAIALLLLATWWRLGDVPREPALAAASPGAGRAGPSIAVLPFDDLSAAGEYEWLGDGVAEEVLNLLTRFEGLDVIARTSSFQFKGMPADVRDIARKLDVSHVLEGSVRVEDDRVRITAQLVDGRDNHHLWSQTFDRPADSFLSVQDDIAYRVSESLGIELGYDDSVRARLEAIDQEARQQIMRGRFYYGRRLPGDIQRAKRAFSSALAIEPDLVDALTGLATTMYLEIARETRPDLDNVRDIRNLLQRALELDPDDALANARMAWAATHLGDDATGYRRKAQRYTGADPMVLPLLAGMAGFEGDLERELQIYVKLTSIDPLSVPGHLWLGNKSMALGRYEDAMVAYETALELSADDPDAVLVQLAQIELLSGHPQNARQRLSGRAESPRYWMLQAMLAHIEGDNVMAEAWLTRLRGWEDTGSAFNLAEYEAFVGNPGRALDQLYVVTERLLDQGQIGASWNEIRDSPFFMELRQTAEWQAWHDDTLSRFWGQIKARAEAEGEMTIDGS